MSIEKAFFYSATIYGAPADVVDRYGRFFDAGNYARAMGNEFDRNSYRQAIQARIKAEMTKADFSRQFTLLGPAALGEYSFANHSFPIVRIPREDFCISVPGRINTSTGACPGEILSVRGFRAENVVNGVTFAWSVPMPEADANVFIKGRTNAQSGAVDRNVVARITYSLVNKRHLEVGTDVPTFSVYVHRVELFADGTLSRRLGVIEAQGWTPGQLDAATREAQQATREIGTYAAAPSGQIRLTEVGVDIPVRQADGSTRMYTQSFFGVFAMASNKHDQYPTDKYETRLWRSDFSNAAWGGGKDWRVVWQPVWAQDHNSALVFANRVDRDRFWADLMKTLQDWKAKYGAFPFAAASVVLDQRCEVNTYLGPCAESVTGAAQGTPAPSVTHAVTPGVRFVAISAGTGSTCGLTQVGAVYCWGNNVNGQLGDGTTVQREVPTLVSGSVIFGAISTGGFHSCGRSQSGAAYCWGQNNHGQLGDGTTVQRESPTPVGTSMSFGEISTGAFHSCGRTQAGTAFCWGLNSDGELGDGTTVWRNMPRPVSGAISFGEISAGGFHSCGLNQSGVAYCWGANATGRVGDGTFTQRLVPTPVSGGITFAATSAGTSHTCGLTQAGVAYCWGDNAYGQLGDGTRALRAVPTPVNTSIRFVQISAGGFHTCGRTQDGAVYCWGWNSHGEIGDGTTTDRLIPTLVQMP